MTIYVITMVEYPKSYEHFHSHGAKRAVGFFSELEGAQNAVKKNAPDYHECLYDFVVIEKFEEGSWVSSKEEFWYQWHYDYHCFEPCNRPECFKGTSCFGMG